MPGSHAAVKHELLVRYLDAWTPAVLHGHRRAAYVEGYADAGGRDATGSDSLGASAVAAARVFGEFADLLDRHTLTMLLFGADDSALDAVASRVAAALSEVGSPPGLVVSTVANHAGPPADTLRAELKRVRALGSPIFGWFDAGGASGREPAVVAATGLAAVAAVSVVASNKSSEVMIALPSTVRDDPYRLALSEAGLGLTCRAELVDASGVAELLVFGTATEKNLEKFKDELWALDEYAGIQLRDPSDDEGTLLDISERPHLGPLRRALAARVIEAGGSTVAELRSWSVNSTVFRASDATRALQTLVAAGVVAREPTAGRLSPTTVIRPTAS